MRILNFISASKKAKYLMFGFCVFMLGVLCVNMLHKRQRQITMVEQVDELISAELPANANVTQVIFFLEAHGIKHYGYVERPEVETDFQEKKLDGKRERIKRYVPALIPNVKSELFTTWHIRIKFYFDENGNLVDYVVRYIGDGL